ncbi:hypothetical protein XA68_12379 [Ophiocordyceps unilateralis]|uniref:HTH La-type RNA-binding domain-containing protein n=1 Tax=Ophiocordyceps unilateralis TaxID=268505 RepID=A0A2A9PNR9_OPHUN|nr:hypothetical protein XA68_12379 [Ophiocordyceps unilateralis]
MGDSEAAAKPAEAEQAPPITADEKPQVADEKPQLEEKHQIAKAEPDSDDKMSRSVVAEPESEEGKPQSIKPDPEPEEAKLQTIKSEPESEEGIKSEPGSEEKKSQLVKDEPESEHVETKLIGVTPNSSGEQLKSVKEPAGATADATAAPNADTTMLKTKAKIDRENLRNNRKFDPSVREVSDDPVSIRKQVEFYFGDWNFPQDKFMWETCEGTANKPIPISKIHSFKRMRTFQPYSAVVAALRDSSFLEVMGDQGQETVKRKVAYKPVAEARAKAEAATVYVKGFGDENPDTQFDLESFFGKYGEIKGLKLRRTNEGLFKGSVFVTFPDVDAAKKFIQLDPAPTYKGHELKIMFKRDYCDEKSELIRQGKLEPNSHQRKKFFEGKDSARRGSRDNGSRGRHDADDWKKRREQDQKNGFQDRRGRGARGRDRGRGRGRGGGRGGRDGAGRGRDGGDRRDNTNDVKPPRIQSTADESGSAPAAGGSKRARDEDGGVPDDAPAAKKVDIKEEIKVEQT